MGCVDLAPIGAADPGGPRLVLMTICRVLLPPRARDYAGALSASVRPNQQT
jgi:hypothetical protein